MFIRLSYEYESLDLGKNIVLYNELSSKTYTIDVQNTDMMRDVIEGSTEEKLSEKYGERWDIFFDILKRNCAVVISKHPTHFFDTWDYGAKGISAKDKNAMPKIQFLTLQLTDMCDLQCKSCGGTYEFPCHVCEGQNRTSACELNLDSLFVFINSLYMYGLNEVTIEGGDPFTNQDRLMKVIDYIQEISSGNIQIVIKTNGVRLKYDTLLLENLKSRNIILRIIINQEYCEIQENVLDILRNENIKYSTVTLTSDNQIHGPYVRKLDTDKYFVSEETFLESDTLDRNTIFNYFHPCIVGKIYVSATGDISACCDLLKKGHCIGNINKDEFASIVADLKSLWQAPEIVAASCLRCQNKKHCHSCPSIKHTMSGRISCPFAD